MDPIAALLIGLAGSLHCIGMCGPIALALPDAAQKSLRFIIGRLLYNIGRVSTYVILGSLSGLLGQTLRLGEYQQAASIGFGILLLIIIFVPKRFLSRFSPASVLGRFIGSLKSTWSSLFSRRSLPALFAVGILNGFLPCGLVYIAVSGALATGGAIDGMFFMLMFGLGTIPAMLTISFAGKLVTTNMRQRLNRLIPVAGSLLAILFIMRGLSLGIPYISPRINADKSSHQVIEDCCKPIPVDSILIPDSLILE